jgi:hypothetical protein
LKFRKNAFDLSGVLQNSLELSAKNSVVVLEDVDDLIVLSTAFSNVVGAIEKHVLVE